jgi:hypothetical protein
VRRNKLDVVRVKETVLVTPNFEDDPIEIRAGWRGTISHTLTSLCRALSLLKNTAQTFSGGFGRRQFGSGLGIKMNKAIYARPPIIVQELAEQLEISRFQLIYDLANMGVFVRTRESIKPEVAAFICKRYGYTLIILQ